MLVDGGFYHLIARGNNRRTVFQHPTGYEKFKALLAKSKKQYRWQLIHYCLMPNHIHLLGQIDQALELPKIMQFLLFSYSKWYQKTYGYVGHLWQQRYKSPLLDKESYFLECGRYIERNPVRAKIVRHEENYRWSSYQHYAYGKTDPLVSEDPYYEELGPNNLVRQARYQEFVKLEGPYDEMVDSGFRVA
jgi:putative transposase